MRFAISALVALTLVGCSSLRPLPIKAGDTCFGCRQVITEPKLATEIIDAGGRAFKFGTVTCMAQYLRDHPTEQPAGIFVTDYSTGKWVAAKDALYVRGVIDDRTMERSYFAFRSVNEAAGFAKEKTGSAVDWLAVQRQVNGE